MNADWTPALWTNTFAQLENDELGHGDNWTLNFNYSLTENLTVAERNRGWRVYTHHAHGRFRCSSSNCSNNWDADIAEVLFRYRLNGIRGTIIIKANFQACPRCGMNSHRPGFSQGEVREALLLLFNEININCYGLEHAMQGLQIQ